MHARAYFQEKEYKSNYLSLGRVVYMTVAGRSFKSGVLAAILSLIIATTIFAALGVPIQVKATMMSPAYLLIGASFNAFCSATIAVYLTLKREIGNR